MVRSVLRRVLDSIPSTQSVQEVAIVEEAVASGHIADVGEQEIVTKDVQVEDAPIQEEQVVEKEAQIQGEHTANAPVDDQFREGIVESASGEEDNDDNVEPVARASSKGKEAASGIPLLTRRPHQRQRKKKLKVNLKPLVARMDKQGKILCSVQSDIQSIFISQSTSAKEMGMVRNAVRWVQSELISIKESIAALGDLVKAQSSNAPPTPPPAEPARQQDVGPLGPISENPAGPSGPQVVEEVETEVQDHVEAVKARPSENVSGPTGPVVSEGEIPRVEEPAVAPEAPNPSPLTTPAPPSPPSSSSAPPAPIPFKQPMPRSISSPTPFPSESSSSPAISTSIPPPPPVIEDPTASSSAGASSSSGPSSAGPSIISPPTHQSFLHPPTPPSFVTFIPESAQLEGPFLYKFKDELEITTIRSVLAVASHVHRTGSPSPIPKKRKLSSTLALPSEPKFPPLWFFLTIDNRRKPIYREYLQKCIFATIFGVPFLNLTDHLNVVLPYYHFSKADQSKIFQMAECKSKDQWAKGHKALYRKFILEKSARFPPRDSPLTLSEWFVIHHKSIWAPFIQKEVKLIRYFQLFNDYRYLHKLLEVQLEHA
ncbi:hypothetical protein Taro_008752 [Colocasia esculenta]|uniref:Uncharacterized protein n=1 Tax=Colocasia esculenta TaxID=4460 RepID=A0A843TUJ7_COLES|nr:hypothetical protein [Colocasia esculenta]